VKDSGNNEAHGRKLFSTARASLHLAILSSVPVEFDADGCWALYV
jgi:hypothetical protein